MVKAVPLILKRRKKCRCRLGRNRKVRGSGILSAAIAKGVLYWRDWIKKQLATRSTQKAEIEKLEKRLQRAKSLQGGKFNWDDFKDVLMGPYGWIALGVRRHRQRKINELKKQIRESERRRN